MIEHGVERIFVSGENDHRRITVVLGPLHDRVKSLSAKVVGRVGLIELALVLAVIAATRYVSAGSITGAFVLPILGLLFGDAVFTGFCVIVTVLAVWRHVPNIKRLAAGEEHKLGEGVKNGG